MQNPSIHQLERLIRDSAADSQNIAFTNHASQRMKQRGITRIMALEALRMGRIKRTPEPEMKFSGLKCRMERLVSGVLVGAVVYVEYPAPELTDITVIDLGE